MPNSKDDASEAQLKKLQRDKDGKKAMAEYQAASTATRTKTAKLKALRLARDAELAAVSVSNPAPENTGGGRPKVSAAAEPKIRGRS